VGLSTFRHPADYRKITTWQKIHIRLSDRWLQFQHSSGGDDADGYDKRVVTNSYPANVYSVKLTVSNEVHALASKVRTNYVISVPSTIYVATNGSSTTPYDTWSKAATNLDPLYIVPAAQAVAGTDG